MSNDISIESLLARAEGWLVAYDNYPATDAEKGARYGEGTRRLVAELRTFLGITDSRIPTTQEAFAILKFALNADFDYAWGWHCNIAMCFVDAGGDRDLANQAAARFMKQCFDVDTSKEAADAQYSHRQSTREPLPIEPSVPTNNYDNMSFAELFALATERGLNFDLIACLRALDSIGSEPRGEVTQQEGETVYVTAVDPRGERNGPPSVCVSCNHRGFLNANGICMYAVTEDAICCHRCTTFDPVDSLRTEGPTDDEIVSAVYDAMHEHPQSPGDVPERIWIDAACHAQDVVAGRAGAYFNTPSEDEDCIEFIRADLAAADVSVERLAITDWLAHRCEYGPPCGRCTYCQGRLWIERRAALLTLEDTK